MSKIAISPASAAAAQPPMRGIERGPYLILSTPVLAVLAEFEARLAFAVSCDPNGGSRHTLQFAVTSLRAALARAEELELWGTLEDVHELTKRPMSTITEWAANSGKGVWCWKKSGVWAVDLEKFDAWYRDNLPTLDKRRRVAPDSRTPADGPDLVPANTAHTGDARDEVAA